MCFISCDQGHGAVDARTGIIPGIRHLRIVCSDHDQIILTGLQIRIDPYGKGNIAVGPCTCLYAVYGHDRIPVNAFELQCRIALIPVRGKTPVLFIDIDPTREKCAGAAGWFAGAALLMDHCVVGKRHGFFPGDPLF